MRFSTLKRRAAIPAVLVFGLFFSFTSMAAVDGRLESADSSGIKGWAWDSDDMDRFIDVAIEVTPAGSNKPADTLKTSANNYRADISSLIGDGWHCFSCPVDWSSLSGDEFTVTAYAVSGETKVPLQGTIIYKKSAGGTVSAVSGTPSGKPAANADAGISTKAGPGTGNLPEDTSTETARDAEETDKAAADAKTAKEADKTAASEDNTTVGPGTSGSSNTAADSDSSASKSGSNWKKGQSLGMFTTTGYCNCELCSGGNGRTYSGTVPKANHTIAADLNVFPLGTKVMIDGIVYTVEDMGSGVNGNKIDIYYDNHADAVAHGTKKQEVFMVSE